MKELNILSHENNNNFRFISFLINVYVVLIGFGLPLVVRDKYFDILIVKYYFFCTCTIAMIIILIGCIVYNKTKNVNSVKKGIYKTFIKSITLADFFILLFYAISVISTITSDYVYESFWGNEGRLTGLFLITWYIVSYFCVSRLWSLKDKYIDIILFAGLLVCIFGITDYFQMDILNFKAPLIIEERNIFTSTIGNINTYTAYIGIIVAMSTVLYTLSKSIKQSIFYYMCMIISFFAIIMGASDNAYLSLVSLFVLLPLFLFNNKNSLQKYLIVIATFLTVVQCIDWINTYFSKNVIGINSAFNIIISFKWLHLLVIILWIIVIAFKYICCKYFREEKEYGNILKYIWLFSLTILLVIVFYIIYDANVLGNALKYGSLSSYLLFDDDWGTNRGYIWRNAIECFSGLSTWKKIFGYGPETFGILLLAKTANNPYKLLFDSAHNEYIQLLLTVGFAGLLSYLMFLICSIQNCIKCRRNNPYFMAVTFGIICYSIQAVVNINLPITTPIFWLLLGISASQETIR